MNSTQTVVIAAGFAFAAFCFSKTLTKNSKSTSEVLATVVLIIAIAALVVYIWINRIVCVDTPIVTDRSYIINNRLREPYQITQDPVVPSVYSGPNNTSTPIIETPTGNLNGETSSSLNSSDGEPAAPTTPTQNGEPTTIQNGETATTTTAAQNGETVTTTTQNGETPASNQNRSRRSNRSNRSFPPNQDLKDLRDIMRINPESYNRLQENERLAADKIRQGFRDEMVFTQTNPLNTVPLGTQLYGYTYLPPENWFRGWERPPVCVRDTNANVAPLSSPSTTGLLEFDAANNAMGPSGIDVDYVRCVLNKENCREILYVPDGYRANGDMGPRALNSVQQS